MATTIGLIRHGVTEWNRQGRAQGVSDIPLNDDGMKQAEALAMRFTYGEWDVLYSSDLIRARQTAEFVQQSLGVATVITDERVREIDCGLMEGTTEEDRIARWGAHYHELDLGMETRQSVAKRGISFLEHMVNQHPDQRVLLVSHGALIGMTLQHLLPRLFSKTYIDNTALTILTYTNNEWECQLYNCTKHL
ncbi:histidine phosphatase family protein [Paenibacillus sp. PR3]|uniref:Histidine phosphatase family protein n=1 Tax=Paenibacillus terricola TaxID=2763503 RepID=A0ABR8MZ21_9BACL|nr:histidine phosphatase family protein [Paenibacillus terricola]MBD3919429.1 histidine phosphatase family protein [Paenibacillus terricola]